MAGDAEANDRLQDRSAGLQRSPGVAAGCALEVVPPAVIDPSRPGDSGSGSTGRDRLPLPNNKGNGADKHAVGCQFGPPVVAAQPRTPAASFRQVLKVFEQILRVREDVAASAGGWTGDSVAAETGRDPDDAVG